MTPPGKMTKPKLNKQGTSWAYTDELEELCNLMQKLKKLQHSPRMKVRPRLERRRPPLS